MPTRGRPEQGIQSGPRPDVQGRRAGRCSTSVPLQGNQCAARCDPANTKLPVAGARVFSAGFKIAAGTILIDLLARSHKPTALMRASTCRKARCGESPGPGRRSYDATNRIIPGGQQETQFRSDHQPDPDHHECAPGPDGRSPFLRRLRLPAPTRTPTLPCTLAPQPSTPALRALWTNTATGFI